MKQSRGPAAALAVWAGLSLLSVKQKVLYEYRQHLDVLETLMAISLDASAQPAPSAKLQRIRRISRPLMLILTAVLAATIAFVLSQAGELVLFDQLGKPAAYVSFSAFWGPGLEMWQLDSPPATLVPVAALTPLQRLAHAGLILLDGANTALMLLNLRGLFALYSRGVVFARENARCMKGFGLWLVVGAVVTNLSGRIFTAVIHAPLEGISNAVLSEGAANAALSGFVNAAMSVVYGAMIYVIAHVLELGREAELERREFI
jgi:hypothetical protein